VKGQGESLKESERKKREVETRERGREDLKKEQKENREKICQRNRKRRERRERETGGTREIGEGEKEIQHYNAGG
jgi:hypothetical protein